MGQYYLVVNLDKKQYIRPHAMGDGAKLLEFGNSGMGTMLATSVVLADGNGRGGGDLTSENPVVGSWAGDRVVIAGDYADDGKFVIDEWTSQYITSIRKHPIRTEFNESHQSDYERFAQYHTVPNLYMVAQELFEDISVKVLAALLDDTYLKENLPKSTRKDDQLSKEMKAALELQKQYCQHNWLKVAKSWVCNDCGKISWDKKPPKGTFKSTSEEEKQAPEEKAKVNLPADPLFDPMRDEAFKDMN